MSRTAGTLLLLVLAIALAGCARGGDERSVSAVTERFLHAVAAGDGTVACGQLSSAAVDQLVSQEGKPCPEAVTSVQASGGAVRRAAVYLTSAKVDLAGGQSAFLNHTSDGWRLTAVGCKPQAGKPADEPYTCDLEA